MAKEIERKFLVKNIKKISKDNKTFIKQGYIKTRDKTTVRVRITDKNAYLTIKGKNIGSKRSEFEYSIPNIDAKQMIDELCAKPIIEKVRYKLIHDGLTWEIDIFHGENEGLILAEVELKSENQKINIPEWIGTEVTGEVRYYNSNLVVNPFKNWKKQR